MSTSLLYHAFGIRGYEYTRTRSEGGAVIFSVRQGRETCRCSSCGSARIIHRVDQDEDGRIDRWEYYGPDRRLEKIGFSRAKDGIEDAWSFFDARGRAGSHRDLDQA